ncbi:tubulin tyrosine ligase [Novymonas esmeraldas]|uniref:Tubulin tyrosine ligase n=1 Tax=Novymonas esmeraldas TaxID=1808958 RepID=A0AAW0EXS7_9TRYP
MERSAPPPSADDATASKVKKAKRVAAVKAQPSSSSSSGVAALTARAAAAAAEASAAREASTASTTTTAAGVAAATSASTPRSPPSARRRKKAVAATERQPRAAAAPPAVVSGSASDDSTAAAAPSPQQQLASEVAAAPRTPEERRSLPPPPENDDDDDSGDALDTDTDSSTLAADGGHGGTAAADGATPRAVAPVTSLAGKRHTRVVVTPATAAASSSGGGGGGGGGRRTGAVSASATATGGSSGGGGGAGHHGDTTLRYRTDLDKQVIHFMFERLQHEQTHPTSLLPPPLPPTSATTAASTAGAAEEADEPPRQGRTAATTAAAASTTACYTGAAATAQARARHIAVEEIVVPANGEGEDKNIGLGDWHVFWMHVGRVRHTICSSDFRWQEQQIINHFPDHMELTRKDLMYKNIKRYLRENQGSNYARLTLHTAMDWVAAAANAAGGDVSAATTQSIATASSPALARGRPLSVTSFCFADSVPLTFNIPNDMSMFKEEFQKRRGTQWIVKPTSRSQGKGIFLIDDVRALQRWVRERKEAENAASFFATGPAHRATWVAPSVLQQQRAEAAAAAAAATSGPPSPGATVTSPTTSTSPTTTTAAAVAAAAAAAATGSADSGRGGGGALGSYIVSRYVSNPLLIGGKKFDLRLYVLVTSYKPLVAYLHEDGFARFCATRYAGGSLAQEDLGSHLTNVALQKGDEHYNTSHGGKWSFQNLFLYVQSRYGAYVAEGMMQNIQFLIFHSLRAVEPVMFNDKHSYELYGYDILIDDQIHPHLIEVNASPSMSTTTLSDRLLKEQVLTDVLKILLPPGYPAHNKGMPYWEYRLRTDVTTQQQTGFKLLQF